MSQEHINTAESLEAASGSMEDFADAADLVGEVAKAETNGAALGAILSYRKKVRAQALAECRTALAAPMGQELPPLPEMDVLADIVYAQSTPDDWDADYRATWQKLQVAERNKMQWRAHALQVREVIAQLDERIRHLERELAERKPVAWVYECRQSIEHDLWGEFFSRQRPTEADFIRNARPLAYIDGRIAGTAPEGWKWVPVEPNQAMIVAGELALRADCYPSGIYKDMIAAAPTPINSGREEAK